MDTTITVDLEAVTELAARVRAVGAGLAAQDGLGRTDGGIGDPVVGAAVRSVVHDWSQARGRIQEFLDSVAQACAAAAQAYGQVESGIRHGAGG